MADTSPPKPQAGAQLTDDVFARLDALLSGPRNGAALHQSLRLLAKWRAALIAQDILRQSGAVIGHGPFKGMIYGAQATEGSTSARLLGRYEASLAPIIEDIVQRPYACVMDVGCAEGYYAVGLALRMPQAQIIARDILPAALEKCAALAARNGVLGQMQFGGAVTHSDFDRCTAAKTLVICDIEGAEAALLDPVAAPGLLAADILVEAHDCMAQGLSQMLAQRFAPSHDVQILHRSLDAGALPNWMHRYSDLDRLLALWEWRAGPTPWLWMTAKSPPFAQDMA